MAIDIRAVVTCSLGTLISASISDDYIQGTGLVKYKGSCEISGVITPAIGTVVTFSYTKDGVTRLVPRKLRVLSSFADPFRRTTSVELGCKLTYLSDLRVPKTLGALCDPANASYTQADADLITLPISASSVMTQCLTELDITASSYPLSNKFSIAEFDFSPGYVQVLADLLVSESYCGYLDYNEVLQVFSLADDGGTGPVITSQQIIDLGGIGVGSLPAEAVLVNYSTLRLKQPDSSGSGVEDSPWNAVVSGNRYTLPISYTAPNGSQATELYNIFETSTVYSIYETLTTDTCQPQRVLTGRLTIEQTQAAAVLGGLVSEYLSNQVPFNNAEVRKITQELYAYDTKGNETFYQREVTGPAVYLHGTAGVPWVFSATDYVNVDYVTDYPIEREQRYTTIAGTQQMVQTRVYGPWGKTIAGQQSIASARESFTTATQVSNYLNSAYDTRANMPLLESRIATEKVVEGFTVPLAAEVINAKYAKGGNPNNGYRTESVAEVEVSLGSPTSKRRLELSLPYAPDDTFTKEGGVYKSLPSDAAQKANLFGRVQNKLLMGNRNGANFQLAPEVLPAAPFAPLIVQANGLSAMYRNNGTSWTMDANGIVVSTDALFWGAVGGTGTFWFPVAPGVTTLPTTPPVVDGVMTVDAVAPVWNETLVARATLSTRLTVESLPYALSALTVVPPMRSRIRLQLGILENIPSGSITAAGLEPLPNGTLTIAAPVGVIEFGVPPNVVYGEENTEVVQGAGAMLVQGYPPVFDDPPDSNEQGLVFHFDGSNGATSITSQSPWNIVATVNGNAALSTDEKRFGSASLFCDGPRNASGAWITFDIPQAFGLNDFCVEFWIYVSSGVTRYRTAYMFGDLHSIDVDCNVDELYFYGEGSTWNQPVLNFVRDTWQHVALYRYNGTQYLSLDGDVVLVTLVSGPLNIVSTLHRIGEWIGSGPYAGTYALEGTYIDEVRVTTGSSVYADSDFTPPTAPF